MFRFSREVADASITNLSTLTTAETSLATYENDKTSAENTAESALSALSTALTSYTDAEEGTKAVKAAALKSAYGDAVSAYIADELWYNNRQVFSVVSMAEEIRKVRILW